MRLGDAEQVVRLGPLVGRRRMAVDEAEQQPGRGDEMHQAPPVRRELVPAPALVEKAPGRGQIQAERASCLELLQGVDPVLHPDAEVAGHAGALLEGLQCQPGLAERLVHAHRQLQEVLEQAGDTRRRNPRGAQRLLADRQGALELPRRHQEPDLLRGVQPVG